MRETEMIIHRWCDMCWHEGQLQQEATFTYTVGIVPGEVRPGLKVLDLCETHNKYAIDLLDLLAGTGQRPELPVAPKNPVGRPRLGEEAKRERGHKQCPVCHHEVASNILVAHIWTRHRRGEKRPPMPKVCPICREHIPSPQGMAQHRRHIHDIDAIQDALSGVEGFSS
jgi:hypothetical protein